MHQSRTSSSGHPATAYGVTREWLEALRAEVDRLRRDKGSEIEQRLREARTFGGAVGNDEYWAIKEDEAVLEARIAGLEAVIGRARVVEADAGAGRVATIGSTVLVEDEEAGVTVPYRIVGPHQPLNDGAVSSVSPVGQALLGQAEHASVTVLLPRGRSRRLRVVRIEPAISEAAA